MAELRDSVAGHRLIFPAGLQKSNLVAGGADPALVEANIAFGQPDPVQAMQLPRLRWVQLTSAGYTRYDRDDLRQAFAARGAVMTNSSSVYAEPCALHVLAMMLAIARDLPACWDEQRGPRAWRAAEHRARCQLLLGKTVVILGFGAIAARLVAMLEPLGMRIIAVRRRPTGAEPCRVLPTRQLDEVLPLADHLVNILPANSDTERLLDSRRFALLRPTAVLYNIGRGTTVDQSALLDALQGGRLAGAYLDVADPEPLPPDHPLWSAPNCHITPHTAGGHVEEFQRLVRHFVENLSRFTKGEELRDRIV